MFLRAKYTHKNPDISENLSSFKTYPPPLKQESIDILYIQIFDRRDKTHIMEDQQNYQQDYDPSSQGEETQEYPLQESYDEGYSDWRDDPTYDQIEQSMVEVQWEDYLEEIRQKLQELKERQQGQKMFELSETQKRYLKELEQKAKVKYYKMEFKFDKRVKDIYGYKASLNAKTLFQTLWLELDKKAFELCEVSVRTYVKDYQTHQKKYQNKISRIQRQIENILTKNCYSQYAPDIIEKSYKAVTIEQGAHQYIHFVVKLPVNDKGKENRLEALSIAQSFEGNPCMLRVIKDRQNKIYLTVSNNAYCNKLNGWDLGCRVKSGEKQKFYSYFQPTGEQWLTFSRSMYRQQETSIKQICVYNRFDSTIVLKATIKKQQIYLLSYSKNEKDVYIFLTSPPIYQFALLPPNSYCLPNYLNNWERVQNFLFLKHKFFKENDFLRLFLYSNSYIHLKINPFDELSCKNIKIDIELIQMELNCKRETLPIDIQNSKQSNQLLKLFDVERISSGLKFIEITDRPFLTAHVKWKLSYQIMLLIRFNVIGPQEIEDFLQLAKYHSENIDKFIECLSRRSAGYTNKVAGLNRFRKGVYDKLKSRIEHYFKQLQKNLPSSNQRKIFQDQACLIYKVSLTPSGILPNPVSPETKCRLMREYEPYSDFFIKVALQDDVGDNMKNQRYMYYKIMRRLLDNLVLLGKKYVPLGWSGSQLRASSLWYVSEIQKAEGQLQVMTQVSILGFLGDFDKIAIPAKKAARIGQAFSSSYHFNSQEVAQIIQEDDISQKKFLFTDGIGMVSRELFDDIQKQFRRMKMRLNCCIQIRYKGAKGVLLLNQNLKGKSIVLRRSMIKYQCPHPAAKKYLDILSWDKYYSGYLNRQIIILLKSLEVSDEVFLKFQDTYIRKLNSLDFSEIDGNLLRNLSEGDDTEDAFCITIKSLKNNFQIEKDLFFQQFLQSIIDTKFTQLKKKSRIHIENSARLIGVIDDYGVLEEGQLFCCIEKQTRGKRQRQVITGDVIITRNPSLSPADVRKCQCVSLEEVGLRMNKKGHIANFYESFANCIVFPKKGKIPLTAQISGSDLDGDIFFICWEKKFIISSHHPCETIDDPNKAPSQHYGGAGHKQMLDFFVDFANSQKLGRINNTHTVHADQSKQYANCKECKKLADIHGVAVDYAKSGKAPEDVPQDLVIRVYPDFMEKWNKPSYDSESILGKLFRDCREEIAVRKHYQKERQLYFSPQILQHFPIAKTKISLTIEVMDQLTKFQEEVTQLLSHANVNNQFQLYAGSSADNEELKNDFGRKRLADWLQDLRERHQSMFFENSDPKVHLAQLKNYRVKKSRHLRNVGAFDAQVKHKAALAYVISYYYFCNREDPKLLDRLGIDLRQFCEKLNRMRDHYKYNGSYLGFVWFVVPKIIVNMQNFKRKVEEQPNKKI